MTPAVWAPPARSRRRPALTKPACSTMPVALMVSSGPTVPVLKRSEPSSLEFSVCCAAAKCLSMVIAFKRYDELTGYARPRPPRR